MHASLMSRHRLHSGLNVKKLEKYAEGEFLNFFASSFEIIFLPKGLNATGTILKCAMKDVPDLNLLRVCFVF